jgi:hypothetical protein
MVGKQDGEAQGRYQLPAGIWLPGHHQVLRLCRARRTDLDAAPRIFGVPGTEGQGSPRGEPHTCDLRCRLLRPLTRTEVAALDPTRYRRQPGMKSGQTVAKSSCSTRRPVGCHSATVLPGALGQSPPLLIARVSGGRAVQEIRPPNPDCPGPHAWCERAGQPAPGSSPCLARG